jgi:hypothetical protein
MLSVALGVGHLVAKSVRVFPPWIPVGGILWRFAVEFRADLLSATVGVGILGHMFRQAIVSRLGRPLLVTLLPSPLPLLP